MAKHPEQLLISAVMRTKDHITPLANGITPDLFHVYRDEWKWLSRYIQRRRRTPSVQAFKTQFPGFTLYAVDDVDHYVDEVKQSHMRYTLITMLDQTADQIEMADDMTSTVTGLHAQILNLQSQVLGKSSESNIIEDWGSIYQDVSDKASRVAEHGIAGIPTGFDIVDEKTGGIPVGAGYWVLAGRLGQGKTWAGVRMACAAAWAGYRVQYFALEMSRTQVALRVHTFMASKYGKTLFRHLDLSQGKNFDLLEYKRFLRGLRKHLPGEFFVDDSSSGRVSPMTIAAQIETNRPDVVFIDYLTLMDTDGDDWQAVAALSGEIKRMTERYRVPIVVLAQINRMGEGREPPGIQHIAQSDRIGQDADAVITLKQMTPHVMKMRMAKYRHGEDGYMWYCKFTPNSGHFEQITGDEAEELMSMDTEDDL